MGELILNPIFKKNTKKHDRYSREPAKSHNFLNRDNAIFIILQVGNYDWDGFVFVWIIVQLYINTDDSLKTNPL
jgi:hypothetical protein